MIPYEYVVPGFDHTGTPVRELLLNDWPLDVRERRALVIMLLRLFRTDVEQANGSVIFKEKEPGIYYAKATGKTQLRPRLCRGPARPNDEVTFLVRAIEKGSETLPRDASKVALKLAEEVRGDDSKRVRYRPMPPQSAEETR